MFEMMGYGVTLRVKAQYKFQYPHWKENNGKIIK